MKPINFRGQLDQLQSQIADAIWDIRKNNPKIVLVTKEEFEDVDFQADCYEMRNDITGNIFDVHVLSVDENGILVVDAEERDQFYMISMFDLADTRDMINLYEELHLKVNK
ncbi:MAG: hypothetical protein PQJ49_06220 [Sphaerochaetaceae bacterium]|nr:hypothetical protein [Sphaerochaetaceae bacterium]